MDFTKADGQKIKITFNKPIINDVSEILPRTNNYKYPDTSLLSVSSIATDAGVSIDNLSDDNFNTYWQPLTNNNDFIKLTYSSAKRIFGFRYYSDDTYYPINFIFYGSTDNTVFTPILSSSGDSEPGWHEYVFDTYQQYRYYRFNITSSNTVTYRIYGFQVLINDDTHGYRYPSIDVLSASSTDTDYADRTPASMLDHNTLTWWEPQTFTTQFIKLTYDQPKTLFGFRYYCGYASYYPTAFTFSGSDDDSTYTTIKSVTGEGGAIGWHEFPFFNEVTYRYYKFTITAGNRGYYRIYEFQVDEHAGNEEHFTVTTQEYDSVPNGTLLTLKKPVKSVTNFIRLDTKLALNNGILTNLICKNGILSLEVDD